MAKEDIQIDYGKTYVNFGLAGERLLGYSRGGSGFKATKKIRDIEFDGKKGKTKGMQVIEEIAAELSLVIIDMSMDNLALALPFADYTSGVITAKSANVGVIPDSAYLQNVTTFCKTIGGQFKKITIYNPMAEGDFDFKAKPKGEGEIALGFDAHWDVLDDTKDLYKIEDVANINGDVVKPTATTTPLDSATSINITSNLTAVFSKDIKQQDIIADNFLLVKASDGTVISGTLSYTAGTKTAVFDPTASLTATTAYIFTISRVRDLAGNVMLPIVVNFTTA